MKKSDVGSKLITSLSKISLALHNEMRGEGGKKGLYPTQIQILSHLYRASNPLRVSDIAEALGVTAATVSDSVNALVQKRLVKKVTSLKDRRAVALSLTASGKKEAKRVQSWPDFLVDAVEVLSSEEQAVFYHALLKMIRNLQERGKIPVSKMCITCKFFRPNAHPGSRKPHHCALIDAPLSDGELRLDCPEHVAAIGPSFRI